VLQSTQVTLSHTFAVDEVATDASGAVTVTIKRLDGTVLSTGAATHPGAAGLYTYVLPGGPASPGSLTWQLDALTVDWSGSVGGAVITVRDFVEVVGGFLFGIAEARLRQKGLANTTTYTTATLAERRIEVEQTAEWISGQAWVPRYGRFLLNGSGTDELVTPDPFLRTVRSIKVAPRAGATFTALAGDDLAAVAPDDSGILARDDGQVWPRGRLNILVEYEHGHDQPRSDIRTAAMTHLRSIAGAATTTVPDRAISYTTSEGSVYRLSGAGPAATGIPDVDAAYRRDAVERVWIS